MPFISIDLPTLIATIGYVGIFIIACAESGLLFGFVFPGDSLLFTAGLLASQGHLSITLLVVLVPIAAIIGDSAGYWTGALIGPALFTKGDSFFFNKKYIERTKTFYKTYGPKAIVLARFVPVVRTFTPILAGVGSMPYALFIRYNIIGGVLWGAGVTLLGYFFGSVIPNAEHYLLPIVIVIIVVSFMPIAWEWYQSRSK